MSPVNRAFDFSLGGKGFMLARLPNSARSWTRSGKPDVPYRKGKSEIEYGNLPAQINMKEVWDDWSMGYGDAYREDDRPDAVHWSENFDTRFARQLVHCQQLQQLAARYNSGNTAVDAFAEVPLPGVASPPAGAGAVLVVGNGHVTRFVPTGINTAGSAFDHSVETTGIPFAGKPATWGSFSFIGNSAGSGFYRRGHDGTMTVSALPAEGFTVAGNRLWRRHRSQLLQSCAVEGIDTFSVGNWSATFSIGNGQMAVGDMTELADQVFCGLPDGLYAGDQSGSFFNVLAEMRGQRHPDNARDLAVHNNGILTPHMGGLWWFRPSTYVAEAREVGPAGRSAKSPVRGRIRCVTNFGPWIYAGLWTGSQSFLLAGRDKPNEPYQWHIMQRIPDDAKVSRLFIDSITTPSAGGGDIPMRMWVATQRPTDSTGTNPLYYCPVPRINDNPLTPDPSFTANYCGSARADFGAVDYRGVTMLHKSVEVWGDYLMSGVRYADVYYKVDDGQRTYLGRAQVSPKTTLYFPANNDQFVSGKSIALSVESFTASFNISPVYRTFILNSTARPNSADTITAVIRVGDNLRNRDGGQMRPGATMIDELRAMARGGNPQKLIDLAGATAWVAVLNPINEQEMYQTGQDNPEVAASLQMAVLDYTVGDQGLPLVILDDSIALGGA